MMNHDAVHYTALHNTQPRTILNLTGTTLRNLGNSLAQSWHLVCTILAPRWYNLGTSLAQSWHLVGTILNLVEHNTAQYWTSLATYSNSYTLLCTIAGWTARFRHTQTTNRVTEFWSERQATSAGGCNSAIEGAGVVRSGKDLVKILRLLLICQQCLFKWDAQDAHLVYINSESRSVCTSFAFMCPSLFYS